MQIEGGSDGQVACAENALPGGLFYLRAPEPYEVLFSLEGGRMTTLTDLASPHLIPYLGKYPMFQIPAKRGFGTSRCSTPRTRIFSGTLFSAIFPLPTHPSAHDRQKRRAGSHPLEVQRRRWRLRGRHNRRPRTDRSAADGTGTAAGGTTRDGPSDDEPCCDGRERDDRGRDGCGRNGRGRDETVADGAAANGQVGCGRDRDERPRAGRDGR